MLRGEPLPPAPQPAAKKPEASVPSTTPAK
jgi:hypothetical protein